MRRHWGRVKHVDMAVWEEGVFGTEELDRAKALRVGSGYEESEKQQVGQGDKRWNQRNSQGQLIQSPVRHCRDFD